VSARIADTSSAIARRAATVSAADADVDGEAAEAEGAGEADAAGVAAADDGTTVAAGDGATEAAGDDAEGDGPEPQAATRPARTSESAREASGRTREGITATG
jgi:hypothetical protein